MRKSMFCAAVLVALPFLGGCDTMMDDEQGSSNPQGTTQFSTDPKTGWVEVFPDRANTDDLFGEGSNSTTYLMKRCDGTTMVYARADFRSGIAAVANDPACAN